MKKSSKNVAVHSKDFGKGLFVSYIVEGLKLHGRFAKFLTLLRLVARQKFSDIKNVFQQLVYCAFQIKTRGVISKFNRVNFIFTNVKRSSLLQGNSIFDLSERDSLNVWLDGEKLDVMVRLLELF